MASKIKRTDQRMLRDICKIAAGSILLSEYNTPTALAKRACDIYFALREEVDRRLGEQK